MKLKCFQSVSELLKDVNHLFIVTPQKETVGIAVEAVNKGFEMIWIQQKSDTAGGSKNNSECWYSIDL